ncbi:hypothetical protein [Nocardia takedensis]|uniref:hypothetical protein n=1 Tax=Nocardia takedensis TaxID=259390 RepID=UPI0002EF2B71|nr:hypothetical protein [Nocardia takedensis]
MSCPTTSHAPRRARDALGSTEQFTTTGHPGPVSHLAPLVLGALGGWVLTVLTDPVTAITVLTTVLPLLTAKPDRQGSTEP